MASTAAARYYNSGTGQHHFTTDTPEQQALERAGQFKKEGTGFNLLDDSPENAGAAKVYRLVNDSTGAHLLTTNDLERNAAVEKHGFRLEGNAGAAYTQAGADRDAVERFRNNSGDYVYTSDTKEIADLKGAQGQGYTYEGTAFYTPKNATAAASSTAATTPASLPVNSRYADAVSRAEAYRTTAPASKEKIWRDALSKPSTKPGTSDQAMMATFADSDDDKKNSQDGINYLHNMAYLNSEETSDGMGSAIANLKNVKVPSVKDPMAYYQTLLNDIRNA